MAQELTDRHCRACNRLICTYSGSWLKVSQTYSTCKNPESYSQPGLEVVNENRLGTKDSALEGCTLHPLRCKGCETVLGSICVEAPETKQYYMSVQRDNFFDLLSSVLQLLQKCWNWSKKIAAFSFPAPEKPENHTLIYGASGMPFVVQWLNYFCSSLAVSF